MQSPEKSIINHEHDLIQTLRTLRDNLPRTMVNLVTPPSNNTLKHVNLQRTKFTLNIGMRIIVDMVGKPLECQSIHHAECPCMFSYNNERKRERFYGIMEQWKQVVSKVAAMEEFNDRIVCEALFFANIHLFITLFCQCRTLQ